jgi:hypothetical protein
LILEPVQPMMKIVEMMKKQVAKPINNLFARVLFM